jgi:hypothetical protein
VSDQMIPSIGDQVEQTRAGVTRIGRVWYADQLQGLVKWDNGKSSSLRIGRHLSVCAAARPATACPRSMQSLASLSRAPLNS